MRPSVNRKPGTAAGLFSTWGAPGSDGEECQYQDGAEQAQNEARDDGHRHHLDATSSLNPAVNERRCFAIEHLS